MKKLPEETTPHAKQRTLPQNAALHLWLTQIAAELDREGHTLQDVVKAITKVEIRPTKQNLKETLWHPVQKAMLGTESTTHLTKHDIDPIYEAINKWLGYYFHIHVPWPNEDTEVARLK